MAFLPGSREIISGLLKLSPTNPGLLTPLNLSPSKVTIPAPAKQKLKTSQLYTNSLLM